VTVDEGRVVKDAVAIGGSVTVHSGGRVTGNAVAIGGDVHLKANAHVEGDTVAIGGEILKEEGASLGGSEVAILSGAKHLLPAFWKWSLLDILYGSYLASLMLHILMVAVPEHGEWNECAIQPQYNHGNGVAPMGLPHELVSDGA
jgi:hypothetical protein